MKREVESIDAVILGGGPAGLAAAIALRQKGMDCMVIEALQPAIDKGCGEGLMPGALAALGKLGIEITEEDGYPFRGIRFVNAMHQVDAYFPEGMGMGVRRTRLHQRMVERAYAAGVSIVWGGRAKLCDSSEILLNGARVRYRWLIGADGQASSVRRWAGLEEARKESLRFGFRRHYKIAPWSEYVEVHWSPTGQVYVTPVASDTLCVVLVTRDPGVHRENSLDAFPEIARRLKDAPISSQCRGAVSATRKLRRVANESVALIGDASGSVDAVTGEGLAISFRQAIALAEALETRRLAAYGRVHGEICRLPHTMANLMLAMDRSPALQSNAMRVLSAEPAFFRHLLAVHVGREGLVHFALRHGARLAWQLVRTSVLSTLFPDDGKGERTPDAVTASRKHRAVLSPPL